MRTSGVKLLIPKHEDSQIDWLVVPVEQCRNDQQELDVITCHFRKPHEAWGSAQAFVKPVAVRRSRRRVLFYQKSGQE